MASSSALYCEYAYSNNNYTAHGQGGHVVGHNTAVAPLHFEPPHFYQDNLNYDDYEEATSTALPSPASSISAPSTPEQQPSVIVGRKERRQQQARAGKRYRCTWKGCTFIEGSCREIEKHIRTAHLGNMGGSKSDHEEDFYYTEVEDNDDDVKTPSPTSPPTLSHRDMARPPHEDPEYQRQFVGNFKQGRLANQQQQYCKVLHPVRHIPTSPLAHHNYTWTAGSHHAQSAGAAQNGSASAAQQQHQGATYSVKHARASPRPAQSTAASAQHHHQQQQQQQQHSASAAFVHQQHHNYSSPHRGTSSPVVHHANSSANSVLRQLTQQNVTVTAHHGTAHVQSPHHQHQHHHQQQQQQQMSTITITPNYHAHPTGGSNNNNNNSMRHSQSHSAELNANSHSTHSVSVGAAAATSQHHHQQQQHHHSHHNSQSNHHHHSHSQHQQQPHSVPHSHAAAAAAAGGASHHHASHGAPTTTATTIGAKHPSGAPGRRTRGENKKCRKVYGMEKRDQWCTQCKWKKACSRFGD